MYGLINNKTKNKKMDVDKAVVILENYNKWRRDNSVPSDIEQPDHKEIGEAIDSVVNTLKVILF